MTTAAPATARANSGSAPRQIAALSASVAARYAGCAGSRFAARFAQGYVRSKLRRDPATAAVLALAAARPCGRVLDLGCGRGQLGLALLEAGLAEEVAGLDLHAGKIAQARAAAAGLPARFEVADLAAAELPEADTVLVVDVLYQMDEGAQRALLGRAAAAARRRVVIRAFDPEAGWRSAVGLGMEQAGRLLRGELGHAAIRPLPLGALAAPLHAAGFATTVRPCWAGTPLPNVLLVAERVAA